MLQSLHHFQISQLNSNELIPLKSFYSEAANYFPEMTRRTCLPIIWHLCTHFELYLLYHN